MCVIHFVYQMCLINETYPKHLCIIIYYPDVANVWKHLISQQWIVTRLIEFFPFHFPFLLHNILIKETLHFFIPLHMFDSCSDFLLGA